MNSVIVRSGKAQQPQVNISAHVHDEKVRDDALDFAVHRFSHLMNDDQLPREIDKFSQKYVKNSNFCISQRNVAMCLWDGDKYSTKFLANSKAFLTVKEV